MQARAALVVAPALLVLSACGEQASDPDGAADPGAWRTEHLDLATSVDFPTLMVSDGDDVLVLAVSDEGVVQSQLSAGGAEFEAGAPLDLGEKYAVLGDVVHLDDGSWYALGSGGVVGEGDDESFAFDPLALRSADGLTWERVEVSGFADAVEFNDVQVIGDRIVAAGDYRTEKDPGMGGFEAHVWTSDDGRSFTEVRLPGVPEYRGYDDESYVGDVVTVDGDLLAAGRVGRHAALWRSDDDGSSWSSVDEPLLDRIYAINSLRAVGTTVMASTTGSGTSAMASTDGGATWSEVEALPVDEEAESWAPLWAAGDRFFTLVGVDDQSWSSPEVCYADLDQCGANPPPRVVASADGTSWTAIDLPDSEIDEVVGTDDGRILVLAAEGGVVVRTWPAGAELPVADGPATPETVELRMLDEGEEPTVGVTYAAPLYTHCGIDWFWFGETTWKRTDGGPDYETGAGDGVPEGWPVPPNGGSVYGYATVGEDGVLTYTDGEGVVLATYEENPNAPGCD